MLPSKSDFQATQIIQFSDTFVACSKCFKIAIYTFLNILHNPVKHILTVLTSNHYQGFGKMDASLDRTVLSFLRMMVFHHFCGRYLISHSETGLVRQGNVQPPSGERVYITREITKPGEEDAVSKLGSTIAVQCGKMYVSLLEIGLF